MHQKIITINYIPKIHKHYFEKFFSVFRESFYVFAAAFPSPYVQQTLRIA